MAAAAMAAQGGGSTVVADQVDPAYEPTRQEIIDYATWLGMDPETHSSLLWIAREALKEDLPPGWKLCQTPQNDPFYFNFKTAESSWEHPCDDAYKQLFADEKLKMQERRSPKGGTPRCDAIETLAETDRLEACLQQALQCGCMTEESAAIVRANVADGLLSADYYVEWWMERIDKHTASNDSKLAKRQYVSSDDRTGTVEAALDRLLESERWKVERFLESDRTDTGSCSIPSNFPETNFWEDQAAAVDLQAAAESSGWSSPQRRERTAQYIARRLLSDSDDEGCLDEECGAAASAPVTPASSAGSSTEDVRSSLEWIPGGMWVASMLPDVSIAGNLVDKLKAAVSPRAAPLAQPSVLPIHSDAAPARDRLIG